MHLFGDRSGPHLTHFHARREGRRAFLQWEVGNAADMHWRVLRSETDFAEQAETGPSSGQTLVMEGTQTHATDETLDQASTYFYTVFAADEHGAWHRQVKVRLRPHHHHLRWHYDNAADQAPRARDALVLEVTESGAPPWHPM
jgi:hypothetical protein